MTSKMWADYFAEFPDDDWKVEESKWWRQLVADLAAAEERAENAERAKYGTPCHCESWIAACRDAENERDALAAKLEEATELLEWTENDDWLYEPGFAERRDAFLNRGTRKQPTLVERVADVLYYDLMCEYHNLAMETARRIIAMVRRHDKAGKR